MNFTKEDSMFSTLLKRITCQCTDGSVALVSYNKGGDLEKHFCASQAKKKEKNINKIKKNFSILQKT